MHKQALEEWRQFDAVTATVTMAGDFVEVGKYTEFRNIVGSVVSFMFKEPAKSTGVVYISDPANRAVATMSLKRMAEFIIRGLSDVYGSQYVNGMEADVAYDGSRPELAEAAHKYEEVGYDILKHVKVTVTPIVSPRTKTPGLRVEMRPTLKSLESKAGL